MKFPFLVRLRHWFIISRWQKWLFPVVCCIPYLAILGWLLMRGLFWVAQVLLAPLLMGAMLLLSPSGWPTKSSGLSCLVVGFPAALTDLCSSFPTILGPLLA